MGVVSGICKIVANGGGAGGGYQYLFEDIPAGSSITAYGPVLALAPAGAISDNEAWELVNDMQSYPKNAVAGDVATLDGERLSTQLLGLRSGGFVATVSLASYAANRSITIPDPLASGIIPVVTGTITNTHSLCASGTLGVYQDCVSGSGSVTGSSTYAGHAPHRQPSTHNGCHGHGSIGNKLYRLSSLRFSSNSNGYRCSDHRYCQLRAKWRHHGRNRLCAIHQRNAVHLRLSHKRKRQFQGLQQHGWGHRPWSRDAQLESEPMILRFLLSLIQGHQARFSRGDSKAGLNCA